MVQSLAVPWSRRNRSTSRLRPRSWVTSEGMGAGLATGAVAVPGWFDAGSSGSGSWWRVKRLSRIREVIVANVALILRLCCFGRAVGMTRPAGGGTGDTAAAVARYMQGDGIHPNREGVALIVEDIGPRVLDLVERARR